MASTYTSLADLAKINDKNARDMGISDILRKAPVLAALAATQASNGTSHKYLKETTAPVVGFRAVNAGLDNSVSGDTAVTIALAYLDASFAVDKAIADEFKDGAAAFLGRESSRHLAQAMFHAEQQIFNGTGAGDASGFAGLSDALGAIATSMVYSAGGTTAATGSSVYGICTSSDETGTTVVLGNDGEIKVDESVVQRLTDGSNKFYSGYWTPISAYYGLQIGGAYSVGRMCNLTADAGHGLTDAKISDFLSLFPVGGKPTFLAMNRRSLKQLQQSRTATNPTGAPAPFPEDSFGIPIIATDAILSTEAIVT